MIRSIFRRIIHAITRRWRRLTEICSFVLPEERVGREVRRIVVVSAARQVELGRREEDPFIAISKYYPDGTFQQPAVFVAEVPRARLHVGSGLVCTPRFRALADANLLDRVAAHSAYDQPKPRRWIRLPGAHTTIQTCFAHNAWHWLVDCLPKLLSLQRAIPDGGLNVLMPETITPFQRDSMLCLLGKFTVSYLPRETWVETETFHWASLASGRCNAFLPPGYFDEMRARIFERCGLTEPACPRRRLYITRRQARHRRVKNDAEVTELFREFSFEIIELEHMNFRDQVELFRAASFVAGPHGAGLASTIFSGPIPLLVFYPTSRPPNYFHTQACALEQRHLFLTDQAEYEDASLSVDVVALRRLLEHELTGGGNHPA